MKPTALIYSSHDRCEYIHRYLIVERALESLDNKTIMHLPMSGRSREDQEYDYGCFKGYYDKFSPWGLKHYPFFWTEDLRREDVDIFFRMLWHSQVVVLGGGNSSLGLARYKAMGDIYYRQPRLFGKILHERQERGLLTAGFSAGADQLGEYLCGLLDGVPDPYGFGIARNIVTTLHFEHGREQEIYRLAKNLPHCLIFGLPNDSGIGVHQGYLPSGNFWQVIWFLIDCSWDDPKDAWHIKTRQGVKIQHYYNDGRHWAFNGGDMMVRISSPDNRWQWITIITNQGRLFDYWTQRASIHRSIEQILGSY